MEKLSGLYIHIPYCTSRCSYCAFAVVHNGYAGRHRYFDALKRELDGYLQLQGGEFVGFETVSFGGGTPSLVEPELIAGLIDAAPLIDEAEISIEVNPESCDPQRLAELVAAGVTRASVGVQSFDDRVLKYFGRSHDAHGAKVAIEAAASSGFDSVSIDLVYGAPVESERSWDYTVDELIDLSDLLQHLSAYALQIEPRTKLHWMADPPTEEADLAGRYLRLDERLAEVGLKNYEISNWSRPGAESRHNSTYWNGGGYLGIGMSSHSFDGQTRWWNVANLAGYLACVEGSGQAVAGSERLTNSQIAMERIMLGLRTSRGLDTATVAVPGRFLDRELEDWFEISGDSARLTARGRLLADAIALRILQSVEEGRDKDETD